MLHTLFLVFQIMLLLGIVFSILLIVNITTKTIYNVWKNNQPFSWKKMRRGLLKGLIFYLSAMATSIAFAIIPFINVMIIDTFGVDLISNETLEILSTTAVIGIVLLSIISQGKLALEGIKYLSITHTNDTKQETD